jgi:short-subunit dehydrogenase involved in D-alanine esterification of teichoic acids
MEQDLCEIAVGAAQRLVAASRTSFEQVFARMNGGF